MKKRKLGLMLGLVIGGGLLFAGCGSSEKVDNKNESKNNVEIEKSLNDKVEEDEDIDDSIEEKKDATEDKKDDVLDDKDREDKKDDISDDRKENIADNREETPKKESVKKEPVKKEPIKKVDTEDEEKYKKGVSATEIDELEDKYKNELASFSVYYGSAFSQYGGPVYGDNEEVDIERANEFFLKTDKILNDLWKELQRVLSTREFKALQQKQVAWIKEKENKAEESAKKSTGNYKKINYKDTEGRETFARIRFLINEYL